jgi:hypothetical protein
VNTLREKPDRGKKRFLERLIQEEEAEREIAEYLPEEKEDCIDNDEQIPNQLR